MPSAKAQIKRQFRGAWIQCVNGQFIGLGTERMKDTLTYQLDELQKDGVNAVIFQVRPECDALYESDYEPWSRFLTGTQGREPYPYWDPLKWMIEECHKRGMELHAWINPYRARLKSTTYNSAKHITVKNPELCFSYDNQLILNPALPEVREYTYKIVKDIVSRYDIDGFHIDDYFYPYPAAGQTIPDEELYRQQGSAFATIGDWRRDNVNVFIKGLEETIHNTKPWVKFGVSPFGIYRNKKSDPANGSETNGLQNYDDLYADVLKWVNNGWVDYLVPQLYWQIGHPAADYKELINWWDKHASARPLYIGEDVVRSSQYPDPKDNRMNQIPAKHILHMEMNHVEGTVLWYAKAAVDNVGNVGNILRSSYWKYPALPPLMSFLDNKSPKKPRKLEVVETSDGPVLFWTEPKAKRWGEVANRYVIYRFNKYERINLKNPAKIQAITYDTFYKLPIKSGTYTYVVTALDRVGNESDGKKIKVKAKL